MNVEITITPDTSVGLYGEAWVEGVCVGTIGAAIPVGRVLDALCDDVERFVASAIAPALPSTDSEATR